MQAAPPALLLFMALLHLGAGLFAQTQQPFLITGPAGVPAGTNLSAMTFARNDTTGAITLLPNTSVNFHDPCVPSVFAPADLLLFGPCGEGVAMYTLNGTTGLVAEVPTSPFAASTANSTVAIVAESTGQYVYLLKANFSGSSSANNLFLDTFQINQQALTLVPISSQNLPFTGAWVNGGAVVDPNGHGFAVLLNQNQGGAEPVPVLYLVNFDPASGLAILPANGTSIAGVNAQSLQISPKGQYLAANFGPSGEFLNVYQLSTSTFQVTGVNTLNVGSITFASRGVLFDPSGTLIYVQSLNPSYPPGDYTNFVVFDAATLTALAAPVTFEQANNVSCGPADPFGPFVYCENLVSGSEYQGIAVYQVDPITGVPTAVPNSPFYSNLAVFPTVFTASASQQGSSTPTVGWSPSTLMFPATTAGQSSTSQSITFKNVGTLPVTFSSVSFSGANPGDFSKNDQCTPLVVLGPGLTCTISIVYAPANAGTSQAILSVVDDAAGSPQQIGLTGTAIAPMPAVSLSPSGSFTFPGTVTQGTSGNPQNFLLTNTGSGALHVSSITVSGFNAADFVVGTSSCLGTVAPSATCSIPVTFAPLAAGIRTTTLQITDDAAGSPQTITLNGTASAAITAGPAPNGSTTATVTPGQTAQYNLQFTPGSGYTGVVALACSGTPQAATCQLPATVQITNGNPAPFTVTVNTTGSSSTGVPFADLPRVAPPWLLVSGVLSWGFFLLWMFLVARGTKRHASRRLAVSVPCAVLGLLVLIVVAGCGGGSQTQVAPPPVTPQGSFTLTITPSATAANGKPLQLQAFQLTLTVD